MLQSMLSNNEIIIEQSEEDNDSLGIRCCYFSAIKSCNAHPNSTLTPLKAVKFLKIHFGMLDIALQFH